MIRGLTLHQVWPHLILGVFKGVPQKTIENRNWKRDRMIGHHIAIHVGKTNRYNEVVDFVASSFGDDVAECIPAKNEFDWQPSHIIGVVKLQGFYEVSDLPTMSPVERGWFVGQYGWVLQDVTAIDPAIPTLKADLNRIVVTLDWHGYALSRLLAVTPNPTPTPISLTHIQQNTILISGGVSLAVAFVIFWMKVFQIYKRLTRHDPISLPTLQTLWRGVSSGVESDEA